MVAEGFDGDKSIFVVPEGSVTRSVITHRGLYFSCHINGATALPIQYADSMTALTVTRLVWPAVTVDNQESDKTNPVVPTPKPYQNQDIKKILRSRN